jgi:predicted nucleic acid-binding protein
VQKQAAPLTLLDACAVVNLYATRWMGAILAANGGPFAVADVVMREARFVLHGGAGEDAREREPVDLQSLQDAGLLEVIASDDEEELLTFIDLSAEIDDGEAMTAALAMHRGCIVVTDDRKASRVLVARGVALRTSLDLIRVWSTSPRLTRATVRTALADLRQRGNYDPPRGHPLRDWWDDMMTRV